MFGLIIAGLGWLTFVGTVVFILSDLISFALLPQKRTFCIKRLFAVSIGFLILIKGHQFRHDQWFRRELKPKFEQEVASWKTGATRLTADPVQQTVIEGFVVFGSTNAEGKVRAVFQLPKKVPRENFLYAESILSADELDDHGSLRMVDGNWYFN